MINGKIFDKKGTKGKKRNCVCERERRGEGRLRERKRGREWEENVRNIMGRS